MASKVTLSASPTPSGATLYSAAKHVSEQVQTITTLLGNTRKNPSRSVNAFWTLFSGCAQVCSGNPFGTIGIFSGAREVVNLSSIEQSQGLQSALNAIQADAELIGMCAQVQKERYEKIDQNLGLIRGDVQSLYSAFDKIQQLNSQGIKELQVKKKTALHLNRQAITWYKQAERCFARAQRFSSHSRSIFEKCTDLFQRILEVVKDTDMPLQEKTVLLEKMAKQVVSSCQHAQSKLDEADQCFTEGLAAFQKANELKAQATAEFSIALEMSSSRLRESLENAQYTRVCEARIQNAQEELSKAKQETDDILFLVKELKKDLTKAEEICQSKWSTGAVTAAAMGGYVAAGAGAPPLAAISIGLVSAYGFESRKSLYELTKGVCDYMRGVRPPEQRPLFVDGKVIDFQFYDCSTGWLGWAAQRPSFTAGTFYVDLGEEQPFSCTFNLNEELPVPKRQLVDLFLRMVAKLENGTISHAHCLKIISDLQSCVVPRGEYHEERVGLIKPDDFSRGIVRKIESFCEKQLVTASG